MKHLFRLMLLSLMLLCANNAHAVYVENMPVAEIQPNGDTIHFFATGDEFYHRYHDADGFTIVQNSAGYWVYAMSDGNGSLQPSSYLFGSVNPAAVGLQPGLKISHKEWLERLHAWDIPEQYRTNLPKTSGRNHGDFCNLVIFIRFADDTAYTRSLASIDRMFSDSTEENTSSLYNYFKHASYNKIFMRTYYAPEPDNDNIRSYQSPHPRGYYMPYTDNNPIGYTNYNDRTNREFELLVGAVNFVNDSFPIPSSYNLDCDNDGNIDNVNFVVKGSYTGWSDLLWPHKWNLYGYNVFINGKRVNTFNFALEGAGSEYFGTSTFCHEMFHSLGAPDLYRYNQNDNVAPVGQWDLMANNATPPQHMSTYMKYKYGNWIDSIPLITEPGTYTIQSVADSVYGGSALRFPSSDPNQFYVVEYRDNTETFETKLPGRGLLIYRIDTRFDGNAGSDGYSSFDEIWLFRPGSNSSDENGQLSQAHFSSLVHRSEFSPSTDPYPYLTNGSRDLTFSITNIGRPGNGITFTYSNRCKAIDLQTTRTTTVSASLKWNGLADAYRVYYRHANSDEPYQTRLTRSKSMTIVGLDPNQLYEWTVVSLFDPIDGGDSFADSTDKAHLITFHTELCNNPTTENIGTSTNEPHLYAPFAPNEKYSYTQELYLAHELGGAQNISTIQLQYAHTTACDRSNCTIYMANTSISMFNDTDAIPLDQLTMVYAGPLHFEQGWNEIVLDSTFYYNGDDNLVVAFDDNSGTPSRLGEKFYTNTYNIPNHMSIIYHSDNDNPSPEEDTISGTRSRNYYRNNIKFTGCPANTNRYYACIISDNDDFGHVSGEGSYAPNTAITIKAIPTSGHTFKYWNDGNTDNPRTVVLTQDTIFIAHFHSPLSINDAEEQAGFVLLSQQRHLTIQGAEQEPIFIYDLLGRLVASSEAHHADPATFNLPHSGIFVIRVGESKPVKLFVQ